MSRLRTLFPILLAGAAAGGAITALALSARAAGAQDDGRQPIVVSATQRDHMLAEMRGMLASVNGVLRGIATDDTALIRSSAAAAGMAAMQAQMRGRGAGMGMGMGGAMRDSTMRRGMGPTGVPATDSAPSRGPGSARHDSMMARGVAPMGPMPMRDSTMRGGMGMGPGGGLGMQARPEAFRRLGMGTHLAFDSLAALVAAGAPRDTVVGRIATITSSCVSCHAMYRLEVR
jgi:cytochrome c556